MLARTLLLLLVGFCGFTHGFDAKQAHQLIKQQQPELLGDGKHLVSLYYFGESESTAIVGLEQVGDDYLPIRWLLIFKDQTLLGWYYPTQEFPAKFEQGFLRFPKGSNVKDVNIWPSPPSNMLINDLAIPFYKLERAANH